MHPPKLAVDPKDIATVIVFRILEYLFNEELDQDLRHTTQPQSDAEQAPSTHQVQQALPPSARAPATKGVDSGFTGRWREVTRTDPGAQAAASKHLPSEIRRSDSQERSADENVARYIKEAQEGRIEAQFSLGCMFMTGLGVERDAVNAIQWYDRAAQGGHAKAQFNLGVIYDKADGAERDVAKALHWYREAAKQGVVEAQFNLASLYFTGDGVAKSTKRAVKWFRRAAERGLVVAQNNVATFYEKGIGVELNAEISAQWYREAAQKGLPESQYMLGVKYGLGHGIPANHIESFRWIRYAASQGHVASQWLVAAFYFEGHSVCRDHYEAYKWALVANKHSDDNGLNRTYGDMLSEIQTSLNVEQKRRCESIIDHWMVKDWNEIMPLRSDPKCDETPDGPKYELDVLIEAAHVLLKRWNIGTEDRTRFMGFSASDQQYVERLLEGREMLVQGSETEDRIGILYYIRCILGALFRDKEVESRWLRASHPQLEGKSPMDLIMSGPRTDLLAARNHVDWVSGRLGC